jgi:hypothetical protein
MFREDHEGGSPVRGCVPRRPRRGITGPRVCSAKTTRGDRRSAGVFGGEHKRRSPVRGCVLRRARGAIADTRHRPFSARPAALNTCAELVPYTSSGHASASANPATSVDSHGACTDTRSRSSLASTPLTVCPSRSASRSSVTTCSRGIRTSISPTVADQGGPPHWQIRQRPRTRPQGAHPDHAPQAQQSARSVRE